MDIIELIKSRRSIRRFSKTKVKEEVIDKLIEAGRWAPSGLNNQPWKFIIVKNSSIKQELAKLTKYGNVINKADLLIVVFLDHGATYNRTKDLQAIGACIQNILLEAYSLSVGSCWLGEILKNKEKVEKILDVTENMELMAVIAIGYPEQAISEGYRKPKEKFIISRID